MTNSHKKHKRAIPYSYIINTNIFALSIINTNIFALSVTTKREQNKNGNYENGYRYYI